MRGSVASGNGKRTVRSVEQRCRFQVEKEEGSIGTFKAFVAKDGVRLFIGVNDSAFQDNVGELEITITY